MNIVKVSDREDVVRCKDCKLHDGDENEDDACTASTRRAEKIIVHAW